MSSFYIILLSLAAATAAGHQMTVRNKCNQVIWVGTFGDNEIPANGGFRLGPGQSKSFPVRYQWRGGRIWARTQCDDSGRNCGSGDCGATYCRGRTIFDAVTLAEFGLDSDFMGLDFWDISQVDGFNVPMSIAPVPSTVKPGDKCKRISCNFNYNTCPNDWKQYGRRGMAGCKSLCSATKEDKYCCPESKGYNRNNCPSQPSDGSRLFKRQCPDAYSWAYDDETSTFACQSASKGSSSYEVVFCP